MLAPATLERSAVGALEHDRARARKHAGALQDRRQRGAVPARLADRALGPGEPRHAGGLYSVRRCPAHSSTTGSCARRARAARRRRAQRSRAPHPSPRSAHSAGAHVRGGVVIAPEVRLERHLLEQERVQRRRVGEVGARRSRPRSRTATRGMRRGGRQRAIPRPRRLPPARRRARSDHGCRRRRRARRRGGRPAAAGSRRAPRADPSRRRRRAARQRRQAARGRRRARGAAG